MHYKFIVMEKIRKHLLNHLNKAERNYWDTRYLIDTKTSQLNNFQLEINKLNDSFAKIAEEREYYQNLLNELNEAENGKNKTN